MSGRELSLAESTPVGFTGRIVTAYERIESGGVDPDDRRNPRAAQYHQERLTESTRRAYLRWIKQYLYFCSTVGRREVPATAATLEDFMIWVAELQPKKGKNAGKGGGMSPNTMRQALAAVHALHDAAGENWPSTKLAQGIIDGQASKRAKIPGIHDDQGVPPILLPTLLELIRACPVDTHAGVRDRAMLGLGFQMMARRSELASLDIEHLTPERGAFSVWVPKTKTDKINGRTAIITPWDDYPEECPVRALRAWIALERELGIVTGPLLRGVDKWDTVNGAGPYAGPPGLRMDPITVEIVIARAAARAVAAGAQIDNAADLRPHSLRAGGATSSYEAGADILSIARQGGWGDRSPVVFRYIRGVDLHRRNPMRLVGNRGTAA